MIIGIGRTPHRPPHGAAHGPSADGVLISFNCDDINKVISRVIENNGKVVIPKAKIEADCMGYFAVIEDSEGNHVGLYSE